ncbi:hypothetical protein INT45_012326 [Circinella minor]|uniref:C2H2-type domain-containing protein n=1 Tax=Circinella minor TaxID=1195481 RepID=A0A8H7RRM2_9FUNG|nr:hypothetical protein INT45_012326 [Circinella minor]
MLLNDAEEDSFFSITDCSGRQVSLLNNDNNNNTDNHADIIMSTRRTESCISNTTRETNLESTERNKDFMRDSMPIMNNQWQQQDSTNVVNTPSSPPISPNTTIVAMTTTTTTTTNNKTSKRRHQCSECHKSFTTSGHLARHNRIHTGEKNFPCLFPGCQSRFSRQDNMMQHYRTHMSPRSRRSHNKRSTGGTSLATVAAAGGQHATTRNNNVIKDTIRPKPRLHAHHRIRSDPFQTERPLTIDQHLSNYHRSNQERSTLPSIHHMITSSNSITTTTSSTTGTTTTTTTREGPTTTTTTFYQHRPLTFSKNIKNNGKLITSLLSPSSELSEQQYQSGFSREQSVIEKNNHNDINDSHGNHYQRNTSSVSNSSTTSSSSSSSPSSESLSQFANIVSTFG